jgi:3-methyladenine DNA glycosylase AlkD
MSKMVKGIRQELLEGADEQTKESGERFFKEEVRLYGLKSTEVQKIAKRCLSQIKAEGLSKAEVFQLCEELWTSGYHEEAAIACAFSESQNKHCSPDDFEVFEGWLKRHVSNWAMCDTLCNHTVGDLLMHYPELADRLLDWAESDNRWVKRGAAVSLIIPARKGFFQPLIFQIADALLTDPDDMVQKGYGWMLKAASEHDMQAVFKYVMANKKTMPRTSLRYAIEKMPAELKKQAMER